MIRGAQEIFEKRMPWSRSTAPSVSLYPIPRRGAIRTVWSNGETVSNAPPHSPCPPRATLERLPIPPRLRETPRPQQIFTGYLAVRPSTESSWGRYLVAWGADSYLAFADQGVFPLVLFAHPFGEPWVAPTVAVTDSGSGILVRPTGRVGLPPPGGLLG